MFTRSIVGEGEETARKKTTSPKKAILVERWHGFREKTPAGNRVACTETRRVAEPERLTIGSIRSTTPAFLGGHAWEVEHRSPSSPVFGLHPPRPIGGAYDRLPIDRSAPLAYLSGSNVLPTHTAAAPLAATWVSHVAL